MWVRVCAAPGGLGACRVSVAWPVCVSGSERVRADTATPASRCRASASARSAARRGPSAAAVRAQAGRPSVRPAAPPRRPLPSQAFPQRDPSAPSPGWILPRTHAHSQTYTRAAGAAPDSAAAAAASREAAAAPPTAEPRPGPRPRSPRGSGSCRRWRERIQQLEANLPRGWPSEVRSAPQRPPEDSRAPGAPPPRVDPTS